MTYNCTRICLWASFVLLILTLAIPSAFRYTAMGASPTRTLGVKVGDWAKYVHNSTLTPQLTDIQYGVFTVVEIVGTNVTVNAVTHFTNGTEKSEILWLDVATGNGRTGVFMIISSGLTVSDSIYVNYPSFIINGTFTGTYAGKLREVLFIRVNRLGGIEMIWDRTTGFMVESTMVTDALINATGERVNWKIVETNMWSSGTSFLNRSSTSGFSSQELTNPQSEGVWESASAYKSDEKCPDLGHYDYKIEVTAVVEAFQEGEKYTAAKPGDCSARAIGQCPLGDMGRLYGWDLIEEKHEDTGFTEKTAWHTHSGTFGAFVFWFGHIKTEVLRVTAKLSKPVGGFAVPVDKLALLAPYFGLASTAMIGAVATAVYVRRVKRRKEKQ